jgi:hypothetical protein
VYPAKHHNAEYEDDDWHPELWVAQNGGETGGGHEAVDEECYEVMRWSALCSRRAEACYSAGWSVVVAPIVLRGRAGQCASERNHSSTRIASIVPVGFARYDYLLTVQ